MIKYLTYHELEMAPSIIILVYLCAMYDIPMGGDMISEAKTNYPEYFVKPDPLANFRISDQWKKNRGL
jgi:hypothetical protein